MLKMTREEFAAEFEPVNGWKDDAELDRDYKRFREAVLNLSRRDLFDKIVA
jgi:hypothetical protein